MRLEVGTEGRRVTVSGYDGVGWVEDEIVGGEAREARGQIM